MELTKDQNLDIRAITLSSFQKLEDGQHTHHAVRKTTGELHGMPWVLCHCECGATKFDTDLNWTEPENKR